MGRKRREYTYEEYIKAMELLEKGYGLTETCRLLGWPEARASTLYYWKHGVIPPAAKWKAEPSRELAYITGVLHGDGSVYKNEANYEYKIELAVIDKEFAETFSKVIAKLLNRKYIEPWWNKKEKKWQIEYRSKAFYQWYKRCEEKGLEGFKPYIEHDTEMIRYYLKGLFDSEGCNYRNKRIKLSNSNIELLEYVQYLLKKYYNIISTGPYLQRKTGTKMIINGIETLYNRDFYVISICRKQHIQKFLEEIGFSIVRKQLGLRKHEKVLVEGRYVKPYRLVELGLFRLPFSNTQ